MTENMVKLESNESMDKLKTKNKIFLNELLFRQKCLKLLEEFRNCLNSFCLNCKCDQNNKNKLYFKHLDTEYKLCYEDIEYKLSNNQLMNETVGSGHEECEEVNSCDSMDQLHKIDETVVKIEDQIDEKLDNDSNEDKNEENESEDQFVVNFTQSPAPEEMDNSPECEGEGHRLGDGPMKCCECEITFPTFKSLLQHLRVSHNCCLDPISGRFNCNWTDCHYSTHRYKHLTQHMWLHRGIKAYQCDWPGCDSSFMSKGSLNSHRKSHIGIKKFLCEECNKSFMTRHNLKVHKWIHTNEKNYECEWPGCEASFRIRSSLNRHRKQVHRTEPDLICDWPNCGRSLRSKASLQIHTRIHKGLKPIVCKQNDCRMRFYSKSNMNKHFKTKHQKK